MKTKQGFVSNSSSCSFIILVDKLTDDQLLKIQSPDYDSQDCGKDMGFPYKWDIAVDNEKGIIQGYTSMTNFDMQEYLISLGVPEKIIDWDWGG